MLDVSRKGWLERMGYVDLFEDLFLAILMTLEEILFSKYNKNTSVKENLFSK